MAQETQLTKLPRLKHYCGLETGCCFEPAADASHTLSWQAFKEVKISLGRVSLLLVAKSKVLCTDWARLPEQLAAAFDAKMRAAVWVQHAVKIRLPSEMANLRDGSSTSGLMPMLALSESTCAISCSRRSASVVNFLNLGFIAAT